MYEFDTKKFRDEYFDWMLSQIGGTAKCWEYTKLLRYLDRTAFYWVIPMDGNRAGDAYTMRQDYADSGLYSGEFVDNARSAGPASVLEVLLALARKVDSDILWDENQGDQTSKWFWIMVKNLGVKVRNRDFDINSDKIQRAIEGWMEHDGKHYAFILKRIAPENQRKMDLWMQANQYF